MVVSKNVNIADILVSVIVPCYNQAQYLEDALQSVLEQTYPTWECIIVNDGSTDNSEEIAKTWTERDPRFSYVFQKNKGLSNARNKGLIIAKGNYIQFLDSDDFLCPEKFKSSIEIIKSSINNIVISNFNVFFENVNQIKPPFCILKMECFNLESILLDWDNKFNIPIHCGFFQKSFFEDFKFPEDLRAKEDWIMWLSFFKNSPNVYFIDTPLVYYRTHRNSMTKNLEHMKLNSIKATTFLREFIPEKLLIDYLYFNLEKKNSEIINLEKSIYNIKNSRGFKCLEVIKENRILKFIIKKISK